MSSLPVSGLPARLQSAIASRARPCDHAPDESDRSLRDPNHKAMQQCVKRTSYTAAEAELARLWNWMADRGRKWVRCTHLAEDVAGEAVERAWMQFGDSLRWDLHCRWVATTARNILINARKRKRDSGQDAEACVDPRTCSRLASHGASELFSSVKASISPGDRETLLLMETGESTAEIAASRGVTVRAVQQSMVRIRCAFAAALNEE